MSQFKADPVFLGDGRTNYHADQWRLHYMSACDFSYLAGCSFPGFTVVGDGVYLLATRMSNMVKQEAMFLEVSEFLLTIRRPLFRFIVYIGDRASLGVESKVFRYPFVEPRRVFSGEGEVWGELPYIDGVRVVPPVQIGIPYAQRNRMAARFDRKLPVIWVEEERCIQIQRQHVVFAFDPYEAPGVWSYTLRDNLAMGGRADAAHFCGLRNIVHGNGSVVFLAGMLKSKSGYGVGQFGALIVSSVAEAVFRGSFSPSEERFNVHIPCWLVVAHLDRALWPVKNHSDGSRSNIDPGYYADRHDVLSSKRNRYDFERRPGGNVYVGMRVDFYGTRDRDVRTACPDYQRDAAGDVSSEQKRSRRKEVDDYHEIRSWATCMSRQNTGVLIRPSLMSVPRGIYTRTVPMIGDGVAAGPSGARNRRLEERSRVLPSSAQSREKKASAGLRAGHFNRDDEGVGGSGGAEVVTPSDLSERGASPGEPQPSWRVDEDMGSTDSDAGVKRRRPLKTRLVRERESSYVAQKRERRSPIRSPRERSDDEISLTAHVVFDESDDGRNVSAPASASAAKAGGSVKVAALPVVAAREPAGAPLASAKPVLPVKVGKGPAVATPVPVKPVSESKAVSRPAVAAKDSTLQVTVGAGSSGGPSRVVVEREEEKGKKISKKNSRCAERVAELVAERAAERAARKAAKKKLYDRVLADIAAKLSGSKVPKGLSSSSSDSGSSTDNSSSDGESSGGGSVASSPKEERKKKKKNSPSSADK